MTSRQCVPATPESGGCSTDDRAIEARIVFEYIELPGLSLTLPQAARLFDLDMTRCAHLLKDLVDDGTLWTDGYAFLPRAGR
jgi:hypothetical protein